MVGIIHDFLSWCKGPFRGLVEAFLDTWGVLVLLVLATCGAFGLGRLSALEEAHPIVAITQAPEAAVFDALAPGGEFVASKTGSVYYYPWCTGAQKIGAGNKRIFATEKAAQDAGYRPAKNCKGLVASEAEQ